MLGHPSGDSFSNLQPHVLESLRGLAHHNREIQFVPFLIHHQQGPVVRTEILRHFLHDGLQDRIQIEGRGERLGHIMEDVQLLSFAVGACSGLGHEQHSSNLSGGVGIICGVRKQGQSTLVTRTLKATSQTDIGAKGKPGRRLAHLNFRFSSRRNSWPCYRLINIYLALAFIQEPSFRATSLGADPDGGQEKVVWNLSGRG